MKQSEWKNVRGMTKPKWTIHCSVHATPVFINNTNCSNDRYGSWFILSQKMTTTKKSTKRNLHIFRSVTDLIQINFLQIIHCFVIVPLLCATYYYIFSLISRRVQGCIWVISCCNDETSKQSVVWKWKDNHDVANKVLLLWSLLTPRQNNIIAGKKIHYLRGL